MANKLMYTLTVDGSTYEVADFRSRKEITLLRTDVNKIIDEKFDIDDIDTSLSTRGKLADAKAVGDALASRLLLDGSKAMTGNLNMSQFQIVNLASPINNTDATPKNYVDTEIKKVQETVDKQKDSFEKLNIITYTHPEQFGCTVESSPSEICNALPNGSIFSFLSEELKDEKWNFPEKSGLVQIIKNNTISDTGNIVRTRIVFYNNDANIGDYHTSIDDDVFYGVWYKTPKMITSSIVLSISNWIDMSQTVNVSGVTKDETKCQVIISPSILTETEYCDAEIKCIKQGSGMLTFSCQSIPSTDITVNVIVLT